MTVDGIDVSKWQGQVDWPKVAGSGRAFAFIKSSEGEGYTDPRFVKNWNGARDAGVLVGAYHFARVSEAIEVDAADEAEWFVKVMTDVGAIADGALIPGVLPAVLDIEWDQRADGIKPAKVLQWCQIFLAQLEQRTKRTPIVYCGPSFWKFKLSKTTALQRYPLWEVCYTTRPQPKPMGAWQWTFWQHSAKGSVPGVKGSCDVNRFVGDVGALRRLAGLDATPETIAAAPECWTVKHPPPADLRLPRLDLGASELSGEAVVRLHALLLAHFDECDGLLDGEGGVRTDVSPHTCELVATLKQQYGLGDPHLVDAETWWVLIAAGLADD